MLRKKWKRNIIITFRYSNESKGFQKTVHHCSKWNQWMAKGIKRRKEQGYCSHTFKYFFNFLPVQWREDLFWLKAWKIKSFGQRVVKNTRWNRPGLCICACAYPQTPTRFVIFHNIFHSIIFSNTPIISDLVGSTDNKDRTKIVRYSHV